VARTKNGQPLVAPLSARASEELARLPEKAPDALVFAGRSGRPYGIRRLWEYDGVSGCSRLRWAQFI